MGSVALDAAMAVVTAAEAATEYQAVATACVYSNGMSRTQELQSRNMPPTAHTLSDSRRLRSRKRKHTAARRSGSTDTSSSCPRWGCECRSRSSRSLGCTPKCIQPLVHRRRNRCRTQNSMCRCICPDATGAEGVMLVGKVVVPPMRIHKRQPAN